MKPLTEFVGTFLFLFTISLAAVGGSPIAPIAIGGALMVAVYMGGHRSGAHYNPAVSLGVLLRGRMSVSEFVAYVIAQVAAGLLAFALGYWITGKGVALAPGPLFGPAKALIVELVFTLFLVLTVLNVATEPKTEGNSYYGLAIGFAIVIAAIAGGAISGGAFNPAVGIGAVVVNAIATGGSMSSLWIYIVGPLLGGAIAAAIFKMQARKFEPVAAAAE
ncbi:MAG TPA: aquaporin [Chthonomonadales bacterium]|nr:aquaporin [Chthonomonadales bacterium]